VLCVPRCRVEALLRLAEYRACETGANAFELRAQCEFGRRLLSRYYGTGSNVAATDSSSAMIYALRAAEQLARNEVAKESRHVAGYL